MVEERFPLATGMSRESPTPTWNRQGVALVNVRLVGISGAEPTSHPSGSHSAFIVRSGLVSKLIIRPRATPLAPLSNSPALCDLLLAMASTSGAIPGNCGLKLASPRSWPSAASNMASPCNLQLSAQSRYPHPMTPVPGTKSCSGYIPKPRVETMTVESSAIPNSTWVILILNSNEIGLARAGISHPPAVIREALST